MRAFAPQPKCGLFGPQISVLIRTFSCFSNKKITCKALNLFIFNLEELTDEKD